MAATFVWEETNGTTGVPTTSTPANYDWKNIADSTTAYTASPITAGNNSFGKWIYGKFTTGTFNNLLNGKWSHTAGVTDANTTLWGAPTMTADADRLTFATPSTTLKETGTVLTTDRSAVVAIGSGSTVYFGSTGPSTSGKAATVDGSATRYTNYLTTQLATTASATAGTTTALTITLQYDEN